VFFRNTLYIFLGSNLFVPDSFLTFLETRLAEQKRMPKGERTRERLRIATLQVLNERGYDEMRTLTITEQAGLSEGLFYVYFKSKIDVTLDLLNEFYFEFVQLRDRDRPASGPLETIKTANRRWLRIAMANVGLMRCIFQAGNEVPEFAALINHVNKTWYDFAVNALEKHRPAERKGSMILPLYMLGGMMDELARKLVVYPDPELIALIDANASDYDAVADAATIIWYRVLGIDEEAPEKMSDLTQQLMGHI
jgi:TetR/AcrR family transcriptional regulator, transcriptional repressor for nem operon